MNISQQTQLTVQVVFGCIVGANYTNYLGGLSTVDVVNDQLS